MKVFAADIKDIFGSISPPAGMGSVTGDPIADLGKLPGFGLNIFLAVAGLACLIYLLWGAFDWISSSGEKEKVQKAQSKITDAVIGMLLIFVVFAVFSLLAGDLLGIIKNTPDGWKFNIPTLQ